MSLSNTSPAVNTMLGRINDHMENLFNDLAMVGAQSDDLNTAFDVIDMSLAKIRKRLQEDALLDRLGSKVPSTSTQPYHLFLHWLRRTIQVAYPEDAELLRSQYYQYVHDIEISTEGPIPYMDEQVAPWLLDIKSRYQKYGTSTHPLWDRFVKIFKREPKREMDGSNFMWENS